MRLMSLRKISLAVVATLLGGGAIAQGDVLNLSLDKAIEIAMDENPTIKVAELDIVRAEYVLKESKSSLVPTVDAQGGYTNNILLPVMFLPEDALGPGTGGAMRLGFMNGVTGAVNASIPLYMPTIYRNIAMTKEQLAMSVESARASKVNMAKEVKGGYYNLLLAEKSLFVLLENKSTLETNVKDIQKKLEQGLVSEYDLLTAQVQLQNLLPTIDKAKAAVDIAHYMIKVLLSLPQEVKVVLTDTLHELNTRSGGTPSDKAIDLSRNTDLTLSTYQINLQEHQYRLSRANRLPQLVANFNFTTQAQSDDFKIANYNWASSSLVTVGLKIPIFTGLKNKHTDSRIKIEIEKSIENQKYLERNLTMQVLSVISNIKSAKAQIASSEVAISQAKKAYSISSTRFKVGAGTILELNSAQVALMQAELNLNQAYYDMLTAYSEYSKLIGSEK